MKIFKNISCWFMVQGARFKRKPLTVNPEPLTIHGIAPAPLTAEPDEAELAAQALLEHMAEVSSSKFQVPSDKPHGKPETRNLKPETRDANYYKELASRIRSTQEAARLRAMRFVAFVEQELEKPHLPVSGKGSLGLLEHELLKRIDVIERVGGELKKRWQHCLATVTVRLMQATSNDNDNETTN